MIFNSVLEDYMSLAALRKINQELLCHYYNFSAEAAVTVGYTAKTQLKTVV